MRLLLVVALFLSAHSLAVDDLTPDIGGLVLVQRLYKKQSAFHVCRLFGLELAVLREETLPVANNLVTAYCGKNKAVWIAGYNVLDTETALVFSSGDGDGLVSDISTPNEHLYVLCASNFE
ncbi:MAG: uncharacterized protein A8A55_0265 [Amphiamblys sp. WSBS2006]|nr:MAG: uncharacterized protein A8A55_0265 [Amphiamblys sp. WSBS2006]